MEGKTRFVDCVINWIRSGSFDSAWDYHWFWRDGIIRGTAFSVDYSKKWFKPVVKLTRWVEEPGISFIKGSTTPRRVGYKIPITDEEAKILWDLQEVAMNHENARSAKYDREHAEKIERLSWWP